MLPFYLANVFFCDIDSSPLWTPFSHSYELQILESSIFKSLEGQSWFAGRNSINAVLEKWLEIILQGFEEDVYNNIHILYTVIYWYTGLKYRWIQIRNLDLFSEDRLLKGTFNFWKVEKQSDIQPIYTDIQRYYTLNMCKK